VKVFKRWLEDDLEGTALENKNSANEELLKEKYKYIFFWDGEGGDDDDTPEIRQRFGESLILRNARRRKKVRLRSIKRLVSYSS
jgi:hypothetical protein